MKKPVKGKKEMKGLDAEGQRKMSKLKPMKEKEKKNWKNSISVDDEDDDFELAGPSRPFRNEFDYADDDSTGESSFRLSEDDPDDKGFYDDEKL